MIRLLRYALVLLAVPALLPLVGGCVDYNRGAVIQMNISPDGLPYSDEDRHYGLYAIVNGGPVEIERFKVLRSIDDCQAHPQLTSPILRVQRFVDPLDESTILCGAERRLGALDTIDPAAGLLVGGVRIDTAIDLSTAERLIITLEADPRVFLPPGDRSPGPAVLVADVADGVAPFDELCADAPESRRGVRRGAWVRAPGETPCAGRVGTVAVVPAVDETR